MGFGGCDDAGNAGWKVPVVVKAFERHTLGDASSSVQSSGGKAGFAGKASGKEGGPCRLGCSHSRKGGSEGVSIMEELEAKVSVHETPPLVAEESALKEGLQHGRGSTGVVGSASEFEVQRNFRYVKGLDDEKRELVAEPAWGHEVADWGKLQARNVMGTEKQEVLEPTDKNTDECGFRGNDDVPQHGSGIGMDVAGSPVKHYCGGSVDSGEDFRLENEARVGLQVPALANLIEREAAVEFNADFTVEENHSKINVASDDKRLPITEEEQVQASLFSAPKANTVPDEQTIQKEACLVFPFSMAMKSGEVAAEQADTANQDKKEKEKEPQQSPRTQIPTKWNPDGSSVAVLGGRVDSDKVLKIVASSHTCQLDQNVQPLANCEGGEETLESSLTTFPIQQNEEALGTLQIIKPDLKGQLQNGQTGSVPGEGSKSQVAEPFGLISDTNDIPVQGELSSLSLEPDPYPVSKSLELIAEHSFKGDCKIAQQQITRVANEVTGFSIGDLVWAKVKSHPWWPGQIFDPVHASPFAKSMKKPGHVLVAFFGDHTFGWLRESQLISFQQHFSTKVEQTATKSFCNAVSEALDEVCRRVELGLCCVCHCGTLHSADIFPDENTGIQVGTRLEAHRDISAAIENLKPETMIEYVRGVACTPFSFWNFTLQGAEARGQVYAFRTVAFSSAYLENTYHAQGVRSHSVQALSQKLKRKISDVEAVSDDTSVFADQIAEAKKVNFGQADICLERDSIVKKLSPGWREQPLKAVSSFSNEINPLMESAGFWSEMEKGCSQGRVRKDSGPRKGERFTNTQLMKGNRRAKKFQLPCTIRSPQRKKIKVDDDSDGDAQTLFSLAGYNVKLLKKFQKGSFLQHNVKRHRILKREISSSSLESRKEVRILAPEMSTKKSVKNVKKDKRIGSDVKLHGHNISTIRDHSKRAKSASEQQNKLATNISLKELKNASNDVSSNSRKLKNASDDQLLPLKELKETSPSKHPSGSPMGKKVLKTEDWDAKKKLLNACPNHLQQGDVKKSLKLLRIGECIQRVASELTGSPPITKCLVRTSGKKAFRDARRKSVAPTMKAVSPHTLSEVSMLKSPLKCSVNKNDTFGQVLQGLLLFARDPMNYQNVAESSVVTHTILKFRDAVFLKSPGYTASAPKPHQILIDKVDAHHDNLEKKGNKRTNYSKRGAHLVKGVHTDLVDNSIFLTSEERKRKVKVQTESPAKRLRRSTALVPVSSVSARLQASVTGSGAGNNTRESPVKKNKGPNSRRPTSSVSERKIMTQLPDIQLPSQVPVALCIKFSSGFTLPSEAQLESTFLQFGVLETSGTKVSDSTRSAQVAFKHGCDAEVALNYARENTLFGQATPNFSLCPFSYTHKPDTGQNVLASGREGCARWIDERTPPSEGNKDECIEDVSCDKNKELTFQTSLSSNKMEIPVSGSLEGLPASLAQAFENPDISGVPQNFSPAPFELDRNVSESSGDIRDKMIKLLKQVSLLVGFSSLVTEPS